MRATGKQIGWCVVLAAALGAVGAGAADAPRTDAVATESGSVTVRRLAGGLDHPWGMAFLPDGALLVTERAGRLRTLGTDGRLSEPLAGTPAVLAEGQGGLLDVALDPDFASNRLVYLSFAEPADGGLATTAVGRGRLGERGLEQFAVVFREEPRIDGNKHFGSRIVFARDGTMFVTLGERFQFDPAQDLASHLGKLVRLQRSGAVPDDNPFVGTPKAAPAVWSYGHRNVESAAVDPRTGRLWIAEMGPLGGDELNLVERGRNYGWPLVSWGKHYDGRDIPDPPTRPDFADAVRHWTPVISPSGMVFYTGDLFPAWRGSALIGGLTAAGIVRVAIDGTRAGHEERIPLGTRIRDVEQAPDGAVYVLTDEHDGKILRLSPAA
jgi:glucose/arabinose dehydrogenase